MQLVQKYLGNVSNCRASAQWIEPRGQGLCFSIYAWIHVAVGPWLRQTLIVTLCMVADPPCPPAALDNLHLFCCLPIWLVDALLGCFGKESHYGHIEGWEFQTVCTKIGKLALQKHIDTDRSGPLWLTICVGRVDAPSALPSPGLCHPSLRGERMKYTKGFFSWCWIFCQEIAKFCMRNNRFRLSWRSSSAEFLPT